MAAIKLGQTPKTFKKTVKVPGLDGIEWTMDVVYKYRTKREYGALVDELAADGTYKTAEGEAFSLEKYLEVAQEKNGEFLLRVLDSWGLDAELNAQNAQRLCDEFPGIAHAVLETYRIACNEGRLGN
jgi:hypothetical protein